MFLEVADHRKCRPQPAILLKKRLWHRFFPVNFAKFLRTPFLKNTSGRLLLLRYIFLGNPILGTLFKSGYHSYPVQFPSVTAWDKLFVNNRKAKVWLFVNIWWLWLISVCNRIWNRKYPIIFVQALNWTSLKFPLDWLYFVFWISHHSNESANINLAFALFSNLRW